MLVGGGGRQRWVVVVGGVGGRFAGWGRLSQSTESRVRNKRSAEQKNEAICMYVYIYICTYISAYMHICIYIHIHMILLYFSFCIGCSNLYRISSPSGSPPTHLFKHQFFLDSYEFIKIVKRTCVD